MRDFELDLFLNFGSHIDSHGNALARILSSRLPRVERKARHSRNRPAPQGCLAHLHSIRLFFPDHCSRIEQGFPKAKTAFLLDFASVISNEQMTGFKRVE